MPSKNRNKTYTPHTYYHIYNRGIDRRPIFKEPADYTFFLKLMKRYLSREQKNNQRHIYKVYDEQLELLAFCLMSNHFHLLVYLHDDTTAVTQYMRSVINAYVEYFNKKYERIGHLFQDVFKAVSVDEDPYLLHITRYIHLNPENFREYPYSSYPYYLGDKEAEWIKPQRILELFPVNSYEEFVTSLKEDDLEQSFVEELLADH